MKYLIISIAIIVVLISGYLFYRSYKNNQTKSTQSIQTAAQTTVSPTVTATVSLDIFATPVAQFNQRVTKKPFGIYVTPQNSPIQPERFTGYHTGADAEYEDVSQDFPVYALADGKVMTARTATGYGGVIVIEFDLNGTKHTALYGHIRPSSLPQVGQEIKKGEQIGLLGTGYSSETDGERRHLHFAILSDNRIDLKGYVPNQSELSGWIDPLTLYQ